MKHLKDYSEKKENQIYIHISSGKIFVKSNESKYLTISLFYGGFGVFFCINI